MTKVGKCAFFKFVGLSVGVGLGTSCILPRLKDGTMVSLLLVEGEPNAILDVTLCRIPSYVEVLDGTI